MAYNININCLEEIFNLLRSYGTDLEHESEAYLDPSSTMIVLLSEIVNRDHSFSSDVKFSEKIVFLTLRYAYVRVRVRG